MKKEREKERKREGGREGGKAGSKRVSVEHLLWVMCSLYIGISVNPYNHPVSQKLSSYSA